MTFRFTKKKQPAFRRRLLRLVKRKKKKSKKKKSKKTTNLLIFHLSFSLVPAKTLNPQLFYLTSSSLFILLFPPFPSLFFRSEAVSFRFRFRFRSKSSIYFINFSDELKRPASFASIGGRHLYSLVSTYYTLDGIV